jgi:hypothetical protein
VTSRDHASHAASACSGEAGDGSPARPCARQDLTAVSARVAGRMRLGSIGDRRSGRAPRSARSCVQTTVAAVLILVAFGCCAQAQEWTREELAGPRLFIGLTRGALVPDQEAHLRSFITLQKLVQKIAGRLKDSVKVIRVGDHSWTGSDDWKPLARRGYTHYVIAVPQEPVYGKLTWVDVSWMAGRRRKRPGSRIARADTHHHSQRGRAAGNHRAEIG